VRGCEFQENKPQIELGEGIRRAIISDNVMRGSVRISNESKAKVEMANNTGD
jgi:hypothetical protein